MLKTSAESTFPLLKIVPDFQVNPNDTYVSYYTSASITYLADGGFIIVYASEPNPSSVIADIYGQRYNADGTILGQAFRINTTTPIIASSPKIATLENGDFVVTWRSENLDSSQSYILGQRYKADGTKVGIEFQVSTNQSINPSIVSLSNGGFVVIWDNEDGDIFSYNVYGQRYNANGAKVGQEFRINSIVDGSLRKQSLTALADGGFLATYGSYYGSYGQRYDTNGAKVGQEFQIDPSFRATSSSVASLADGKYLITWYSDRNDDSKGYYGQIYNLDGSLNGAPFAINLDIPTTVSSANITKDIDSITALTNGGFLININLTQTYYNSTISVNLHDFYTQEYDANANPVGQAIPINAVQQGDQSNLSVASLTNGGYAAVWKDQTINAAIFGVGNAGSIAFSQTSYSVNEDGTPIAAITLVRTDGSDGDVSITLTPSDGTATALDDYDNKAIVVSFLQGETSKTVTIPLVNDNRIEADETINLILSNPIGNVTLGSEVNATLTLIDNDNNNLPKNPSLKAGTEFQFFPNTDIDDVSVASLANGGFVFAGRNSSNIFSQPYDANGNLIGLPLQIDTLGNFYDKTVNIASLTDGGFVVTWDEPNFDDTDADINGQRYDVNGNAVGSEFRVNTVTEGDQKTPSVASLKDGGFVVTWFDSPNSDNDIYGQRYDANGNPIGSNFGFNTVTEGDQYNTDITSLSDGGFVVTWDSLMDVYGQRYDANGNSVGSKFRVNTFTEGNQSNPAITSLNDSGFVVIWVSDDLNDYEITEHESVYGQRYDVNGNAVGLEFRVDPFTANYPLHGAASVASLDTGGFVVTWTSYYPPLLIGPPQHPSGSVYGQQFDAQGNRLGSDFLISPSYGSSLVSSLTDGGFVAVHSYNDSSGQIYRPVDAYGVFSIAQLARSGFVNGLSYTPVEIDGLPLASLYDETYYLSQNPDVAAAVSSGVLSNGYTHFVNFGQIEGRDPSILYDETFYLEHNTDVKNAVATEIFSSGFQHYVLFGQQESRSPSSVFNEAAYRVANPDVADAIASGGLHSGFEHYLKTEQSEARNPFNYLYNEVYYLTQYPDVATSIASGQFQDGFQHYITFGQTEHRNPSRLFNENEYLTLNPDVTNAVSAGLVTSGFEHYILSGRAEGREI